MKQEQQRGRVMREHHPSALVILVSVLLSALLLGTFIGWYRETGYAAWSFTFRIFVWTLVLSVIWNSLVRAARERWPR